jgi:hypothetical protein
MITDYKHVTICLLVLICTSASHASDADFCRPKAMQQCLIQLPSGLCNEIKQACERSRSAERSMPPPLRAEYATKASAPALPSVNTPVSAAPTPAPQYIFIRADKLDNPYPGLISSSQALGASFSYTMNDFVQTTKTTKTTSVVSVSSSDSTNVIGLASYAWVNPDTNFGWKVGQTSDQWIYAVPSIWVSGNGNWDHPTKAFGDTSALKAGGEMDFLFSPIAAQSSANYFMTYVGVSGFHQTDFYGLASADGATISVTPSNHELFLMGSPPGFSRNTGGLMDGFLELRGEATYLNVSNPGATLLHAGPYEWIGGAARGYLFFFPKQGAGSFSSNPYLADRLSFVGTYQYYHDANSNTDAKILSAALQYKIGGCDPIKCEYGAPSVTLQYDVGTDRDTLQYTKKLQAKLNYAW